jgi:DNA-binding MarR family transcriptional regulator
MADLVVSLEQRGLISRRRDPDNRRVLLISLTEAGHALLAKLDEAIDGLEEHMLSGLTARQRADFEVYLTRCRATLAQAPPH